jgi:TonB-linked SusC/RagA family outer membrane protein
MKLTVFIVVATLSAVSAKSYSQKVTLRENNITIGEVLRLIEKQTNYHFLYDKADILKAGLINVNVGNVSIETALDKCFIGQPLNYKVFKNTIAIRRRSDLFNEYSLIKDIIVRGTVSDNRGITLPGVSVKIKGTTIGLITDIEGKYSITVPDGNLILVFSYIGFTSQEVSVNGRTSIDIRLAEETNALSEVVVTALGIRREKKALTYSVSEVAGDDLTKAREINVGNALTGRVAGVTASGTSGGPGASTRVIIRGNGSLNGDNQPLYVVNGMPITNSNLGSAGTYGGIDRGDGLSSINPDDIETISVLKGGTAAALYGSRAANGVILITTKSGKEQRGLGVDFNSTYTQEKAIDLLDWQYEYGSGQGGVAPKTQGSAVAFGRTSWGAKLDGSQVIQMDGQTRPYTAQKDNIRNFYQTGSTFSNTVALSGGNETSRFRFSAANLDNEAIVPNNTLNRKTFNLSTNGTLIKKIIFEANAQYSTEGVKNRTYLSDFTLNPNAGTQLIATNIDVRTLSPGYLDNGNEVLWSDYIYATNPYFAINKVRNGDDRERYIGSFSTRYNITDFLYASTRFGIDKVNVDGFSIQPTGTAFNNRGQINTDQSFSSETNVEATIGFNKDFGKFTVNAFAGGNDMKRSFSGINLGSGQLNIPFKYFVGNGSSQTFNQDFSELGIRSLFASADIDFNNFLYLTLSGRNDWFSTLDSKNNNLFYPSVGLSFVASDAWNSRPSWINYAKIRTSWAQVGGGAPNPYALQQTFSAQAVPHLGQSLMNVTSSTIPSLLTPYTSTTYEAGVEMKVFNNRLGLDLTVYDRTTSDDIVNAAIPPSSGYNSVALNVGKMKNRGIELMLNGSILRSKTGVKWDIAYNMAYNNNEVLKIADGLTSLQLPGATTRTLNGWIYHFEGQPFGMIAGFRQLQNASGQLVFNRSSGLPIIGPLATLGRGVPPLALGLNNSFSYKNVNMSFLVDSRWGGSIYSATNAYGTGFGVHKQTVENGIREKGITLSGVDQTGAPYSATIPAETYYRGIAYTVTENFVEDADFIKLRSFTLGYNLPLALLSKMPFQSATLSLVGRNLFILYNASENIDPESNYNNSNAQGLENFGLPTTRSFGLNLSVKF